MIEIFKKWTSKYFDNEEAIILLLLCIGFALTLFYFSNVLVPILVAVALAYLLQGGVKRFIKMGCPRLVAVILVEVLFLVVLFLIALILLPSVWTQLKNFINELPKMLSHMQTVTDDFILQYPQWITSEQVDGVNILIQEKIADSAKQILSFSFAGLSNAFNIIVYVFLIPVLVFFFLKDKDQILEWLGQLLPKEKPFLQNLSMQMDRQISNYARGKVIEILLIGFSCFILLKLLGVRYTILLSVLTGLSVLVPYFGAAAVGVIVTAVGYFQFGFGAHFFYICLSYGILQLLDGNVLVPILFSEVVNLHPVAILIAVLVFGGIWGFWGLFFAIPLATLVHALINSWPRKKSVISQSHEL